MRRWMKHAKHHCRSINHEIINMLLNATFIFGIMISAKIEKSIAQSTKPFYLFPHGPGVMLGLIDCHERLRQTVLHLKGMGIMQGSLPQTGGRIV